MRIHQANKLIYRSARSSLSTSKHLSQQAFQKISNLTSGELSCPVYSLTTNTSQSSLSQHKRNIHQINNVNNQLQRNNTTQRNQPSYLSGFMNTSSLKTYNDINFKNYSTATGESNSENVMHGTTVLCVRKQGQVSLIADGQVTLGNAVMKTNARKLRTIGQDVVAGFAGSTADAITLFERLEGKLEEYPGQLMRACVEMSKLWRTDKYLRRLDAVMVVADKNLTLLLTGNGDVLEPSEGGNADSVVGIGSGGHYAIAAARALLHTEGYTAEDICQKSMEIAADICIYTNKNFTKLTLEEKDEPSKTITATGEETTQDESSVDIRSDTIEKEPKP